MNDLRSFRKLTDREQATNLVQFLTEGGILCKLIEIAPALDSNFGGAEVNIFYEIQIDKSDFEKANRMVESEMEKSVELVEDEHYLVKFTNEELYEILLKPDEWSDFDHKLAAKLLKDRGEEISDHLLHSLRDQRIKDLEKPDEVQKVWIFVGYLFSLLGGLLGTFLGWYFWKSTKTLPDGRKVYSYDKPGRDHGRIIFIIGLIVFSISLILQLSMEI